MENSEALNSLILLIYLPFKIHLAKIRSYSTNNISTVRIYLCNKKKLFHMQKVNVDSLINVQLRRIQIHYIPAQILLQN